MKFKHKNARKKYLHFETFSKIKNDKIYDIPTIPKTEPKYRSPKS